MIRYHIFPLKIIEWPLCIFHSELDRKRFLFSQHFQMQNRSELRFYDLDRLITSCRNHPNCSQTFFCIHLWTCEPPLRTSGFHAVEITTSGEPRPGYVNKMLSFDSRCFGTASVSSIRLKSSLGVKEVQNPSE